LTIHYRPGKSNVSADTLSRFPVDQSDVCIEDCLMAAVMEQGDSSEGEKSELLPGVAVDLVGEEDCLDKGRPEQAIVATVQQDKAKSEEQGVESRQREDPDNY